MNGSTLASRKTTNGSIGIAHDNGTRRNSTHTPSPSPSPSPSPPPRSLRYRTLDLCITVVGIYVCYLKYAILQEQLTSLPQPDGSRFSYPLFLMLVQCVCNSLLVYPIMRWKDRRARQKGAVLTDHGPSTCAMREWQFALLALSYLCGMQSSYIALNYISFPTQVLLKSCKMLPVMFLGALVYRQKYSWMEYAAVACITTGIWAFFAFKDLGITPKATSAVSHQTDDGRATFIGIVLSMVSLTCDGITGATQDNYVSKYRPSSELLMYAMNKHAVLQLLVACFVCTSQGADGFRFILAHPSVLQDLLLFGLVSALGQLFIFHCVIAQGALALSIITSTRKFFTILSSVLYFGHQLNPVQWMAVGGVFVGLFIDIGKKAWKKKNKHRNKHLQQADKTE